MSDETIIVRPHEGFQRMFARTSVNVCISGGMLGGGKTFGAVLATAEPSLDPRWRGLFLRNNLEDLKAGGGIIETFKEVYGDVIRVRESEIPRIIFPSGAYVDVTHIADQSVKTILRRFKGRQYDMVYFDELNGFTWDAFKTVLTRNRGKSPFAGKCIATTNPERECWIRPFIDWYIGEDGLIIPERDGVVRYFFVAGKDATDTVWGDSKEEVYAQCQSAINKKLDGVFGFMKGRDKWPNMIRSFVFYQGRMSENKEMLDDNPDYIGAIAMSGGAEADRMLEGNWNASSDDEEGNLITYTEASSVFLNDPQKNGDRWVTCDLADSGTDNVIMLAWDGLHIIDIKIIPHSTPRENAENLKAFAAQNNVGDSHIIFDALRAGIYINDYISSAVGFESYRSPFGINALQYAKLKDCCYGKVVYLIKHNGISCADDVAKRTYVHQKLRERITIQDEFVEEARVIRYADVQSGKKRLMTKKEMKKLLGKSRSMDILDSVAMRMYPLLNIPDGYELENSRITEEQYQEDLNSGVRIDIYDDTQFGISYGQ